MTLDNQKIIAAALLVGLIGGAYILRDTMSPAPTPQAAPTQVSPAPPQPQAAVTAQPQSAPAPASPALQSTRPAENLAWPSEDLTNPRYRPDNATIATAKDDNAPAGIKTVNRLIEDDANAVHRAEIWVDDLHPGAVYTTSLFVRPVERSGILLELRDNDKSKQYGTASFDLKRAKWGKSGDVANAGLIAMPGGWYRVWAEMAYATGRAVVDFRLLGDGNALAYAGDGKSGLLVSGFQINPGSGPAAYVATTDAPVSSP